MKFKPDSLLLESELDSTGSCCMRLSTENKNAELQSQLTILGFFISFLSLLAIYEQIPKKRTINDGAT